MTEWKTTKIKGDVKDEAAELDATFTEIMEAGIDHLKGCNTQTSSNTNAVTTNQDAEEIVERLESQLERLEDGVKETTDVVQRTERKVEDLR